MKTDCLSTYKTEFQRYIIKRFADTVPEVVTPYDEETRNNHHIYEDFICVLEAPEQYEVEEEMLAYGKSHADASLKDFIAYFMSIVPPSLPPCASEWEDDEEEE